MSQSSFIRRARSQVNFFPSSSSVGVHKNQLTPSLSGPELSASRTNFWPSRAFRAKQDGQRAASRIETESTADTESDSTDSSDDDDDDSFDEAEEQLRYMMTRRNAHCRQSTFEGRFTLSPFDLPDGHIQDSAVGEHSPHAKDEGFHETVYRDSSGFDDRYGTRSSLRAGGSDPMLMQTRYFNVAHSRRKQEVQGARATGMNFAKIRRYQHVLSNKPTYHDERLTDELAVVEEELRRLQLLEVKNKTERQQKEAQQEIERLMQISKQKELTVARKRALEAEAERRRQAILDAQRRRQEEEERHRQYLEIKRTKERRRLKMRAAARLIGSNDSYVGEVLTKSDQGEIDMRQSKLWNIHYVWLCDILEEPGDKRMDFLFLADLSKPTEGALRSKTSKRPGWCIFDKVAFDLQNFTPCFRDDGSLSFQMHFGCNTVNRKDSPEGFKIIFDVQHDGKGGFEGICDTSWWGVRDVKIMLYSSLSEDQLKKFPDPIAKYYPSLRDDELRRVS
eukprot:TRINITY_DN109142_c0_g1_i1.p1 TRINITY_DN109142_c0_g1~~TRINITY_DN109142_c0_g1_i1.p1  ORF type:complete len:506 (+),score=85.36 TRINITY_DN109142_c0_g1_i1:80-1597(+)